jgi:hypothetical protein
MSGAGFEVLLTVDQSIQHQQNLATVGVSVVVLVATSNRLADLLPLVPSTLTVLAAIQPGAAVEVSS